MYVTLNPTELQRWKAANISPNTKSSSFTAGAELLQAIGNKIKDTQQKYLPYSPVNIIIAGGSVRDLLFDFRPKDVDIFISHAPSLDSNEFEDICDLLMSELSVVKHWEGDNKNYQNTEEDEEDDYFRLLEGVFEIPRPIGETLREGCLQLVARPFLTFKDLVNTFDYDLVRGYYDIDNNVFVFHKNMLNHAKSKSAVVSSIKTEDRVQRWIVRNSLETDFTIEYSPEYQKDLDDKNTEMKKTPGLICSTAAILTTNNYWTLT